MRRLFIMRKDLHMSAGKLAAQVAHCAEAYWLHLMDVYGCNNIDHKYYIFSLVDSDIYTNYICDSIVKTICEARNLNHLLKAKDMALELGLEEGKDFGLINDNCLTELTPENEDGTCTTGIWFKPLDDEVAHSISKKYQLYR